MIGRLRRRLIAACMVSLSIVLAVILGGVNLMSYSKVVSDADAVLTLLATTAVFSRSSTAGRRGGRGPAGGGTGDAKGSV